jgi:hypothetical protein
MTRYLSGLGVAGLGLCGGGWLIAAVVAFGGESAGPAERVDLLTGAGLVVVSCVSLGCWAAAWRRRLRVDGVLTARFPIATRREARRHRRDLSRDVGRTARLAKRSARESRRAARRSARLAGSGGGVLSSGAGLGSAPGSDGPYSVSVPPVPAVPPARPVPNAELLSELRAMLVPLLIATGERPAAGGSQVQAPPPPAVPPAGGDDLMFAADGEEAWW